MGFIHTVSSTSLSLSIEPKTFPCGASITASYSYSGAVPTLPLTLYLKGSLSAFSSSSITLPNPSAPDDVTSFSFNTLNCDSPGSWYFFIQDHAYFVTSSNNAAVTIKAAGTSGFATVPVASPTTLSAGRTVALTYSTFGAAANPVTAYIVGATAYNSGVSLGGWTTYPLDETLTIPAAAVLSGAYYIVLRTSSGIWSDYGAPVYIELTPITVLPTTFRAFDTITVTWPASSIVYPADVWIQGSNVGSAFAVRLESALGNSLTTQVTLKHVSAGSYKVYLAYIYPSGGYGYTDVVTVNVLNFDPNSVALTTREETLIASRWAFLAYQDRTALLSWTTSEVCTLCAACAQSASVTNIWFMDATTLSQSTGGNAFLARQMDGVLILSFEGTTDFQDKLADVSLERVNYAGCLAYSTSCGIHVGFLGRYNLIVPQLLQALTEAIPVGEKSLHPIVLVGHSLGGAVATIAAYELSLAGYLVIGVYTFGSPRVGNEAFSVAYNMLVGRASSEFYNKQPLSARRVAVVSDGKTVRPSLLLLEAVGLPYTTLALPDKEFWAAWNEAAAFSNSHRRILVDLTQGAGNAAGLYRGSWRISNCFDPVPTLIPENLGYSHVDTLVQVDTYLPLSFIFQSNLSCTGSATNFYPHNEASYLTALGGPTLTLAVASPSLVTYSADSTLWVAPNGTFCAFITSSPTASQTPTILTTPSTSPSGMITPSTSPTNSVSPTATPSSSMTTSILESPPGLTATPSATLALAPSSTSSSQDVNAPPISSSSPSPSSSSLMPVGAGNTVVSDTPAVMTVIGVSVGSVLAVVFCALLVFFLCNNVSRHSRLISTNAAIPPAAALTQSHKIINYEYQATPVAGFNPLTGIMSH